MSRQFKPGDLALIISARVRHELIGCVVELHQRVLPGERYLAPDASGITYSMAAGPSWVCLGECFTFTGAPNLGGKGWAQVNEKHLLPLRGDFTLEQQKAREAQPCL